MVYVKFCILVEVLLSPSLIVEDTTGMVDSPVILEFDVVDQLKVEDILALNGMLRGALLHMVTGLIGFRDTAGIMSTVML